MLARLSKTLSTNVAVAGLTVLVLGAGGTTATLAASHGPNDHASDSAKQQVAADGSQDDANDSNDDANENDSNQAPDSSGDQGTRPTDTHGYCVSQLAQSEPTAPTGTGADKVTHGSLVSAAAHACGKQERTTGQAQPDAATHGKGYGRNHGTGRPAAVPSH